MRNPASFSYNTQSAMAAEDAASPSPSAASPPAYSDSRKKKPPTSPLTPLEPGLTPTPRPTCTSFSTCTPSKTSKLIARFWGSTPSNRDWCGCRRTSRQANAGRAGGHTAPFPWGTPEQAAKEAHSAKTPKTTHGTRFHIIQIVKNQNAKVYRHPSSTASRCAHQTPPLHIRPPPASILNS